MEVKRVDQKVMSNLQFFENSSDKHKRKRPLFEAKNLKKSLSRRDILADVNLNVYSGEIIGIGGAVGSGKTTLLYILLDLIKADNGKILYRGAEINKNSMQKISFASSSSKLNGYASVMENLNTFANLYGIKNPKEKILNLCKEFNLLPLLKTKVYNLSGGENCRVNLCKAFLNDPELIFLDEISSHLDHYSRLSLIKFLKNQAKKNKAIIFVGHDINELINLSDRLLILNKGKLIEEQKQTILKNLKKYFK